MRKFILWFVFLAVLTAQSLHAQDFLVKGKVISHEDNEPLIGVSVLQEGSTNGIVTDIYGNYTLEIKGTAKAKVECKFIDSTPLLQEIVAEAFTKMIGMSFSGQDLTDEKTTEMLVSIMKEKQKSVKETYVTKNVEFECSKKDNKWIISSVNDAVADVLLSNLVTAGQEFSNSMNTLE